MPCGGAEEVHTNALVAVAFGWHQHESGRCLIQACYRIRGFTNGEAISWLHVPHEWRGVSQPVVPHRPTDIAAGYDSLSDINVVSCCSGAQQLDAPSA